MARTTNRWVQIIVGLLLSLGVALLPLGTWGKAYSGLGKLLGGEVLWWVAVVILLLYVALVERRPFSSVGFRRPTWRDLLVAAGATVISVVGVGLIYALLFPALHLQLNKSAFAGIVQTPFWYRFLLVTRAAVAEELLFRGYPITRVEELSRSRLLAALVSWAAFTYAHLSYWGAAQLLIAGWGGLLLTIVFLWRRNLWVNMIIHWLTDGVGFLLA
ncbi:MAG TPA: type II CAAX endopeptidase family protein [Sphingomicrobium sp.]|nr:type II CAAX endopeptidase family protein [Sphingomicrobium sp.]